MAPQVTMRDGVTGKPFRVNAEDVDAAIAQGFKPEGATEAADRIVGESREEDYGGIGGKIAAGLAGAARGVTLGGSDVLLDAGGLGDDLQALKEVNPYTSIGGEIVGGLASSFTGVGPAGALAKVGAKAAAMGAGKGIVKKALGAAVGGALEGAGQGAGSYVSQVALEDKPLSAEGFLAAAGSGALIGGGVGGGLSLAESALVRARSLFPKSEVTHEAAREAEHAATTELQSTLSDGRSLVDAAKEQLKQNRLMVSASDAETAVKMNALKVQAAEQKLARETAKTEQQAAKASAPKTPRKGRKAFDEPTPEAPVTTAPETPAAAGQGDDLLTKLQGTKQQLDEGVEFTRIGRSADDEADALVEATMPGHTKLADATRELEDAQSALDAWLGKYNTGGKRGQGNVADFERSQASRDFASTMRKDTGYVSSVPEGEGSALLPRGRQSKFRGSAEEKAAADAEFMARQGNTQERMESLLDAGEAAKEFASRVSSKDATAIAGGARNVEDDIASALRSRIGETTNVGDDIGEAVEVISRVEAAQAAVSDALGPAAPASAQARGAAYRGAVADQQEAVAMHAAQHADDIAKKLPADVAVPSKLKPADASNVGKGASKGKGMLERAGEVGTALEMLNAMGINGPTVSDIPVIGPVLGLFIKARAAMAVAKRLGGKVAISTESTIARHAATTRNRVQTAVDKLLDGSAQVARKAAPLAGPAGGLGYKLFDARASNDDKPKGKKNEQRREYEARIAEIGEAMQPNAIADAVRKKIPTSDPALQQALIEAQERKLKFLDAKAPKQLKLPTLLKGDGDWMPNRVQLESFGRYIEAAENPVGVLERLGDTGIVTYEAAETLRTVYPALYKQAQLRLLQRADQLQETLPYSRRVSLSILFQVPVDGTMDASFVKYLQPANQPAAGAPMPAQGSPAAAPPTPTAAGPVMLGDRTMTRLDRRAGA